MTRTPPPPGKSSLEIPRRIPTSLFLDRPLYPKPSIGDRPHRLASPIENPNRQAPDRSIPLSRDGFEKGPGVPEKGSEHEKTSLIEKTNEVLKFK